MSRVSLVRVGSPPPDALGAVATTIHRELGWDTCVLDERVDPAFAFDPKRGQFNSTLILHRICRVADNRGDRVVGVATEDLFIPILTFVFGEAMLSGAAAVVSLHRLRPEFYGLPQDTGLTLRRLCTEAIHELGHTCGLIHCSDYLCAMHASHAADEIDLKGPGYCPACLERIRARTA